MASSDPHGLVPGALSLSPLMQQDEAGELEMADIEQKALTRQRSGIADKCVEGGMTPLLCLESLCWTLL